MFSTIAERDRHPSLGRPSLLPPAASVLPRQALYSSSHFPEVLPARCCCHFQTNQGVARVFFFLQVMLQVKVISENEGIHRRDKGQVFMLIEATPEQSMELGGELPCKAYLDPEVCS